MRNGYIYLWLFLQFLAAVIASIFASVNAVAMVSVMALVVLHELKMIKMTKNFNPTHWLVSRSRRIPVQLVPGSTSYLLQTEQEWRSGSTPAFELRSRLGFFCRGVAVVGYRLQPIAAIVGEAPSAISGAKA